MKYLQVKKLKLGRERTTAGRVGACSKARTGLHVLLFQSCLGWETFPFAQDCSLRVLCPRDTSLPLQKAEWVHWPSQSLPYTFSPVSQTPWAEVGRAQWGRGECRGAGFSFRQTSSCSCTSVAYRSGTVCAVCTVCTGSERKLNHPWVISVT